MIKNHHNLFKLQSRKKSRIQLWLLRVYQTNMSKIRIVSKNLLSPNERYQKESPQNTKMRGF